jgi:hypothetical protein
LSRGGGAIESDDGDVVAGILEGDRFARMPPSIHPQLSDALALERVILTPSRSECIEEAHRSDSSFAICVNADNSQKGNKLL